MQKKRRELPEGECIWDAFSFKKHKPFIDWETRGKGQKKRVEMKKQNNIYLISKGILKQTSFLETHIVSSGSNVGSGRKPVFLQHRQEIKHLSSVTPYKCKMAND